jgi:hypothetical protein
VNAKSAMRHFVRTASIVRRNSAAFSSSIAHSIEKILGEADMKAYIRELEPTNSEIVCGRTFICLAAPSLVGKTQLAFVLWERLPFYFVLSGGPSDRRQHVYKNFDCLSRKLKEFARRDSESILEEMDVYATDVDEDELKECYKYITATNLSSEKLQNKKFWTLGFFRALLRNTKRPRTQFSRISWMDMWISARKFQVEPVSLTEFLQEDAAQFRSLHCVFLDEFRESFANVFVRNLVRCLGVKCFVSNTNTHIANMIGLGALEGSREAGDSVWAMVVCELDPFRPQVLSEIFNWTALKATLSRKILNASVKASLSAFLANFHRHELPHLRPGVAIFFADAVVLLSQADGLPNFSLKMCLDFIVSYVSLQIFTRKKSMYGTFEGMLGNFALNSSIAFECSRVSHVAFGPATRPLPPLPPQQHQRRTINMMLNRRVFLEHHLFFIINPVTTDHWCFFLYRDTGSTVSIRIDGQLCQWTELSCFKKNELITLLACMFGTLQAPAEALMVTSHLQDNLEHPTIRGLPNPQAAFNSGVDLEVSSAISIIDASHYTLTPNQTVNPTLGGIPFIDFLKNVLRNRISDMNFRLAGFSSKCFLDLDLEGTSSSMISPSSTTSRRSAKNVQPSRYIETEFKNCPLKDFFAAFKVPFLGPSNLSWPQHLLNVFPQFKPDNPNLGTYNRTPNNSGIDGIFDIIEITSSHPETPTFSPAKAIVECKHWNSPLEAFHIKEIIHKAQHFAGMDDCPVMFLFIMCNSIGGIKINTAHPNSNVADLLNLAKLEGINIYRFESIFRSQLAAQPYGKFGIIPYRPESPIFADPSLVVLLFAHDDINLQ